MESLHGTARTTVKLAPPFLIAQNKSSPLHSLSSTLTSQNLKKISLNYKLTKDYEDKRVHSFRLPLLPLRTQMPTRPLILPIRKKKKEMKIINHL